MVHMGRLFKRSFGNTKINCNPRFRKATRAERKKIIADETLMQATRRQAESYFGKDYNSLTSEQKRYARQRAKDFRKNIMVRDN